MLIALTLLLQTVRHGCPELLKRAILRDDDGRAHDTHPDRLGSKSRSPQRTESTIVMTTALTGTVNQIEWATQIKERVAREFDRVANAMRSVASKQREVDRADTLGLVAILEEKRLEVMANDRAGYFIHDWQELGDQVRQMVVKDPRYARVMIRRAERSATTSYPEVQEIRWPEAGEL